MMVTSLADQQTSPRPNACRTVLSNIFYRGTPMEEFEYLRIPIKLIPLEIMTQYNLIPLVSDGHIYIEVQNGMYGLPQAGIISNHLLAKRLAPYGYRQTKTTPSVWTH
jgi:hypothetical protein